jgi:hypothetical protein
LLLLYEDRVLGAVRLGEPCQFEGLTGQRAVANDDAIAEIIEVEDRRSDRETAPLTLTDLGVDSYFHGSPFPYWD